MSDVLGCDPYPQVGVDDAGGGQAKDDLVLVTQVHLLGVLESLR